MDVTVFIEGERLDLFDDETISITQGVQNVKDVSKLFADFSRTFSVPASSNNNRIFKHYYNADIDNGFDARVRKSGAIYVNTLNFKLGKISLQEVSIENGIPTNYKITFFGDAVKIKDLLGDDKLNKLTWLSNFDHDYSDVIVKDALINGLDFTVDSELYERAIIYPLISYKRQYLYNSNPADTTSTDVLVNIAYDAGRSDGVSFDELKPAIRLDLVIKAIEVKYGINFTGAFFTTEEYLSAYVNINNSTESLANGYKLVENVQGTQVSIGGAPRYQYIFRVTPDAGFTTIPYKVKATVNGTVVYENSGFNLVGEQIRVINDIPFRENYDVQLEVFTEQDFEFEVGTKLTYQHIFFASAFDVVVYNNLYTGEVIDLNTNVIQQIKDIKVYDFLISVFKMFNLVVVPDGEDLYVNDLLNWYTEGQIYDVTPYIDTQSETVKKGIIYNQINFNFKESDQILADFYRQNNPVQYGDIDQRFYEDEAQLIPLDGEKLNVEVIFENPIFERINDQDTLALTNIQYCPYIDKDLTAINGEPFLFYPISVDVSSNPIGFAGAGASYTEIDTTVFMPSHSVQIDTASFNLNFGAVYNEYTYAVFLDTIYKRFYDDYISDIFSIKRRIYDFDGILPFNLLYNLRTNDRLIIKNTRYIINSITSNLSPERKDRFELINDIYDAPLASDILNTSLFRQEYSTVGNTGAKITATYVGLDNLTATKTDFGDGVGWVTFTKPKTVGSVSNIAFTVDPNTSGLERNMGITITDGINNPTYLINQLA